MDNYREVVIRLDDDSMTVEFDQGTMTEDEFTEVVIEYVMNNIQIEVL